MPFEHQLNLRLAAKHDDGVTMHFDLLPEYLNSNGVLHGGVTASIADEAAWHAIENNFGYGARSSTTTELKVNYLRPSRRNFGDRASLLAPRRKNAVRLASRYLRPAEEPRRHRDRHLHAAIA